MSIVISVGIIGMIVFIVWMYIERRDEFWGGVIYIILILAVFGLFIVIHDELIVPIGNLYEQDWNKLFFGR